MKPSLPSVFVIGSSASLLWGPHLKQMLAGVYSYSRKGDEPAEVAKAFADLDVPQGASAGDSAMVLDYLHALDRAGSFHADVVLMHVGAHDIKTKHSDGSKQVPLASYGGNVQAIAEWFKTKHIRLVWLRSGPLDETLHNARSKGFGRYEKDLDEYNQAADAIMAANGVATLDLAGFTKRLGPMSQLLKDHIHFNNDVVKLQAAFIAGYLMGLSFTRVLRFCGHAAQ